MPMHFERLRERLLREGVASRHVRRYLTELRDHYDDALRDERAKGLSADAAADAAWTRLGDAEDLALSALTRPELRSVMVRFPRFVFGAGPLLMWIASIALTLAAIALVAHLVGHQNVNPRRAAPAWLNAPVQTIVFIYGHLLPVLIGALAVMAARRHGLKLTWPLVGATIIAVMAGSSAISVTLPTDALPGELEIGNMLPALFSDAWGKFGPGIAQGLIISAANFALIMAPALLWERRRHIHLA